MLCFPTLTRGAKLCRPSGTEKPATNNNLNKLKSSERDGDFVEREDGTIAMATA